MTIKNVVVGIVIATSGCASSQAVQRGEGAPMCLIESPRWPSAARDFDRSTTLGVLGNLTTLAAEDRAQLHGGTRSAVGGKLDTLATAQHGNAFISSDVAELAMRLRQLDCSVRAGMAYDLADQRYAQILRELDVEKNILAPSAGSDGSAVGNAIR